MKQKDLHVRGRHVAYVVTPAAMREAAKNKSGRMKRTRAHALLDGKPLCGYRIPPGSTVFFLFVPLTSWPLAGDKPYSGVECARCANAVVGIQVLGRERP